MSSPAPEDIGAGLKNLYLEPLCRLLATKATRTTCPLSYKNRIYRLTARIPLFDSAVVTHRIKYAC